MKLHFEPDLDHQLLFAATSAKVRIPCNKDPTVLAKLTSKNQLTLPKAAVQAVGASDYFDVEVREGQIVLTPVRIQRGDAVRAKLAALGLGEADVADAVRWARAGAKAHAVTEAPAAYAPAVRRNTKKKTPRRG